MKRILLILSIVIFLFTACEKDNYDAPGAYLTGSFLYNGQPVGLKHGEVTFRLYEPGWELSSSTYMNVSVAHDGTFSTNIFSGNTYEIELVDNLGPWQNSSERITIDVNGNTERNIDITPYFSIPTSEVSISGGVATATFSVTKNIPGTTLDKVGLYLAANIVAVDVNNSSAALEVSVDMDDTGNLSYNMSGFANAGIDDDVAAALETFQRRIENGEIAINGNQVTLKVALTDALKKDDYIFARTGVKPSMTGALLYSDMKTVTVN